MYKAVESSNIAGVDYSPIRKELEVHFKRGGIYTYFGVDEVTYDMLMEAPSVGSFFNQHIKDIYEWVRN